MKLVGKIARRFVFGRSLNFFRSNSLNKTSLDQSHGFVSFIASISVFGLALGVTALLVVTSVMNGFEKEMKRSLTAFHGHVLLFSRGEPVENMQAFIDDIPKKNTLVTAITPYVFSEVMLSSAKGVAGSIVEGIHLPTIASVSAITTKIISGRMPVIQSKVPEIVLGSEVARKLQVKVGDIVLLTIPFAKDGQTPLVVKLEVAGIVRLGMYDYDNKYAMMELSNLQKILELEGKVNAFKILTKDPEKSLQVTNALNDHYVYPLRAKDWSSLNRNLFYAVRLEKVVISIILLAIVLVASFNIISTILMMVHDKKRQIAMLKTMGWESRQTMLVFVLIGSVMSLLGSFLGLFFGRLLCAIVEWKSIIDLPADIYMLSRLHIEIRIAEWVSIVCIAIILAIASTLWPSYKMSKESPVEGLRYE